MAELTRQERNRIMPCGGNALPVCTNIHRMSVRSGGTASGNVQAVGLKSVFTSAGRPLMEVSQDVWVAGRRLPTGMHRCSA